MIFPSSFRPAACTAVIAALMTAAGQAQDMPVKIDESTEVVIVKDAPEINIPSPTEAKGGSLTEVYCTDGADFDTESRTATFKGDVKVLDPRFQMRTATLTVKLNDKGSGIESAEASGSVLFMHLDQENKNPTTGEPRKSLGKASRAVLNMGSGEVKLYGYPQLQQDGNLIVGTAPNTVITLSRNGKHKIDGPSKIQYLEKSGAIPTGTTP